MSKKRFLAGFMGLLLLITSFYTSNVVVKAADVAGKVTVNFTGNGTLDYFFYDSQDAQCAGGGTGTINHDSESKTFEIPNDAVKMVLKARAAENWQTSSASGTKNGNPLDSVDGGIFGDGGIIIYGFNVDENENVVQDGFTINLTFTEQPEEPQQPEGGIGAGEVQFEIQNSQNGIVYYSFTGVEDSWNEIQNNEKINNIANDTTTIYVKAVPNEYQSIDTTANVNYVDIAGVNTTFTVDNLTSGAAYFTYNENSAHKVHIEFAGNNGGGQPTTNQGDISLNIENVQNGTVEYKIGESGDWQEIQGSNFTLRASDELKDVVSGTTILFQATPNQDQSLDTNERQNWIDINGQGQTDIDTDQLLAGSYSITYNPENTYSMQIKFNGGGGEPRNVSVSISSMNGNENERVNAVEVSLDEGSSWVDYYNTNTLDSLEEGATFKVRIKMNEGFTIDKVSLDYESFDHNSRVGYFKENNQPNYDAIISALLSDDGYKITFQPEEDSRNSDEQSTLRASETCLRLQYQTAISYAEKVDINMFFQIKDGDNGYGIWKEYAFVDGVGDSGVIFSFNDNNYGENGEPFALGYGKYNTGENQIQVSYVSAYAGKEEQTVTVTPDTYDYFSAGGYTSGDDKNKIRIDDYDGLIDEVYIDVNGDYIFEESEKLTAKDGDDPYIGPYKYYDEETLNAAAYYNILVRKHLSTRVSLKWSYTESGTDFYVDHGKIFIEKVVRGEDTLYQAQVNEESGDLVLDAQGVPIADIDLLENDYGVSSSAGEVFLECGDEVTIRLIPTYGYQIESATLNDVLQLTPNETVSSFTFTVGGNLHMAGTFVEATDETDTTGTTKINDAGITDGQNATDSGNLKLTVADHPGNYAKESEALNLAKGENANATTIATLDMTLNSMVSKGNGEYWTDDITSFENDINVNLELNDTTYVPGDTYVVVREHDEQLEKLETTYSNGMLEVPTNKFSTYSIVKIPVSEENRPNMYLEYDPRDEGDDAGSVTVKCDGAELTGTDGFYKYDDPAREITFELKRPVDRVDTETYTPVVEVVFPQEDDADTVVINPTVTNDTFTVTPSTDSGLSGSPFMEVYVHWSEYDKLGPDENEFMFFLNQPLGGGTFVFQNGLTPVETATLGNESKYIFANGTEVSVELKPEENKELAEVFLFQDDQGIHYSGDPDAFQEDPEEQRNIEDLKVGDKYILSGLSPWAFVDVFFIDIPMLSDITLNTSGTLYDSMKGSDVTVSSTCKIGEEEINGTTKLKDQDSYLLAGINDYVVEFTSEPDEYRESFTVEGTISLTVVHNDVTSIEITTQPTKTTYTYGESFDKTGLVVTAHYLDGTTQDVTDYVTFEGEIVPSNTTIEVKYTRDDVTVTNNITISVSKATPTITLSGLSETTQAPTGVKATLNPADANAQVVIEYQVVDTPAVAATPEVPCNVTHDEGCASLTTGNTNECNCSANHTEHDSECGYQAATSGTPATYKWVTTRPTTPGTYEVRAYLPTGTTNVAAIAVENAKNGTYTLTQYTAPSGGGSNSGSGSGSGSGSSGSSSSGGTTTPAPTTPAETEVTTPTETENTTTATTIRRPAATTEENNEETASETKIGVASEDGAEGWTEIKTEINDKLTGALETEEGEELVFAVEMNGEDTVPSDVFEAIEGQDITVTFDMGNGIVWAVNGMDVTADAFKDINFAASTGDGVTAIPVALITSLVNNRFSMELTLEYEGEFGLTAVMSVNVKKENAGKCANLFYFNPQTETMEYICSAQIKEDGTADLTFTHASDYVIVVDEVIMSVADNTSMEQVQEAAPQETPVEMSSVEKDTAENDSFNLFWVIAVGILILVVGTIAILAVKKKKE